MDKLPIATIPDCGMVTFHNTPEDRYRHEHAFRYLVDTMEQSIHSCRYTPSELREAAVLAAIHYEQRQPRPWFVFKTMDPSL